MMCRPRSRAGHGRAECVRRLLVDLLRRAAVDVRRRADRGVPEPPARHLKRHPRLPHEGDGCVSEVVEPEPDVAPLRAGQLPEVGCDARRLHTRLRKRSGRTGPPSGAVRMWSPGARPCSATKSPRNALRSTGPWMVRRLRCVLGGPTSSLPSTGVTVRRTVTVDRAKSRSPTWSPNTSARRSARAARSATGAYSSGRASASRWMSSHVISGRSLRSRAWGTRSMPWQGESARNLRLAAKAKSADKHP